MSNWRISFTSFAGIGPSVLELNKFTVFAGENNTGKSYISKLLWYVLKSGFHSWGAMDGDSIVKTFGTDEIKYVFNEMCEDKNEIIINPKLLAKIMTFYFTEGFKDFRQNQFLSENKPKDFKIEFDPLKQPIRLIFDSDSRNTGKFMFSKKSKYQFYYNARSFRNHDKVTEFTRVISFGQVLNRILLEYFGFGQYNIEFLPPSRSAYMQLNKIISDYSLDSTFSSNKNYIKTKREAENIYSLDDTLIDFFKNIILPVNSKTNKDILKLKEKYEEEILNGSVIYDNNNKIYRYHSKGKVFLMRDASSLVSEFSPIFIATEKFTEKSNNMLIIDEPESHLHPQKQFLSIDFLTSFYKLNNNVLITTHSDYILHALNNNIKRYIIDEKDPLGINPKDVVCYTFKPIEKQTIIEANVPGIHGLKVDTFNDFIEELRDTTYDLDIKILDKSNQNEL